MDFSGTEVSGNEFSGTEVLKIIRAIENGQNVLLHGPGGCGKSHNLKLLASHFTDEGRIVYCTATTGIAAINLSVPEKLIAGCTIHSFAGIGKGEDPPQKLLAKVNHTDKAKKRWLETDILILDEISMMSADLLDKLDFIGRNIRREKTKPFGGLQFIFSGDFLQLAPVKAKWAFESFVWKEISGFPSGTEISGFQRNSEITEGENLMKAIILQEPKRYDDIEWFHLLLRIRKAEHTPEDIRFLHSRVKAYDMWLRSSESKDIRSIKPTVLHSRKVDVEFQNDKELRKLPGNPKEFIAVDNFVKYNNHARFDDYIKPLEDEIPRCISLNVGAQVMLKANLDIKGGLANGSRGVVTEILGSNSDDIGGVRVKWLNGKTTIVSVHTWIQEDKDGKATRTQMPLILAWAYTIHRAQGCTLDYAICDIGPSCWLPGMAYVALSRVRSSTGLFLVEFYPPTIKADPLALEYVHWIENQDDEKSEGGVSENIQVIYDLHFVGLDSSEES